MGEEPQILYDPTTGRPILMAPKRQRRPIRTAGEAKGGPCPFCPGNEGLTPQEVAAVRAQNTRPGSPGWSVRAFANLYPATACHEVIAEGSEHEEHPAALAAELWVDALRIWADRILWMEGRDDIASTYWFKNVGYMAGASVAHNHSQILGLPMLLPRVALEREQAERLGYCPFCRSLEDAAEQGRLVHRNEHYALFCPGTPKLPYETWLIPLSHGEEFTELPHIDSLAGMLQSLFRAVDVAFDRPPFNMYLHRIPNADFHWHFEIQPRSGYLAGLELGGDMYMNAVPAPEAAERLRRGV